MCPDENELTQFARGGAKDLPALETHLDGCEKCRRAVAAAASEQTLPVERSSHQLSPGLRVERYEIERELGRGGMGAVYQARDVTLDRRVALKLLHARRDEAAQARLLREAQVMAKLSHPNVVPVFELGEWKGDLYLVMELINGVTLEAWLKREKHRSEDILSHFLQAGRGLAAAHAAGVVHRDFKPANVLVGLDDRVRVTDFGLSRPGPTLELPATNSAVVTRDGAIVGTLAYMSPEQLEGKTADERSDQFSFCVSLVEALSGQRPFKGETWSELTVSLGEKPRFGAGISAQLRAVLRKGLEREPAHRYASMTALLNAIERAQKPTGWRAVGLTAVAATIAVASSSAYRAEPAPAQTNASAPAPEQLVPVVMAATELREGTVLTMEMVQQRAMPAVYVTSSIIKPDSVQYVIGQKINVPVQKGDPLLWSQFETGIEKSTKVLTLSRDVGPGTVVTAELVQELGVPDEVATASVVRPDALATVSGRLVKTSMKKGDLLLWNQLAEVAAPERGLGMDEIMKVVTSHHQDLAGCKALTSRDGDLRLGWSVRADGVPNDVSVLSPEFADDPGAKCLVEKVATFRFPKRASPTVAIDLPIRFAH